MGSKEFQRKQFESEKKKGDDDDDMSEYEEEAELEKVKEGAIKEMFKEVNFQRIVWVELWLRFGSIWIRFEQFKVWRFHELFQSSWIRNVGTDYFIQHL